MKLLKRVLKEKIDVYALDKNITKLKNLQKKFKFKIIELDLTNTDKIYEILSKLKVDILLLMQVLAEGLKGY